MAAAQPPEVAAAFGDYPPKVRRHLARLRKLILDTAARTEGVGPITETLRWGEPAYLTEASKSGSSIRIGWKPARPDEYAMYFICTTSLVDTFRGLFPELKFDGNRAILLPLLPPMDAPLPGDQLATCIELALTYKLAKKLQRRAT